MRIFQKADLVLAWILKIMLLVLFASMTVSATIQVAGRFLLKMTFSWTEELCRYSMVWMAFLGSGYAMRTHSHVAVEVLKVYISERVAAVINRMNSVFLMAFAAVLTVYSAKLSVQAMTQYSTGMHLPMGIVYLCIPISGVIIFFYALAELAGWKIAEPKGEQ